MKGRLIMPSLSAGILLFKHVRGQLQVLLVHPGGPFWAKKDLGSWSIPKGECNANEDQLVAAKREFREETGQMAPGGPAIDLGEVKYSNKIVHAWAIQGDIPAGSVVSNTFEMQWPPKSGKIQEFPEINEAGWFSLGVARQKMVPGLAEFISRLEDSLG